MRSLIITGLAAAVAVFAASKLLKGVKVRKDGTLVLIAVLFGLLNAVLGWFVKLLVALALLPVAIVTLGLAYLFLGIIVNAILLWVTDKLMDDFEVKTARALFATAFLESLSTWLLRVALHT
jgi:putative membrane protein